MVLLTLTLLWAIWALQVVAALGDRFVYGERTSAERRFEAEAVLLEGGALLVFTQLFLGGI